MSNMYDHAHKLANALNESEEFGQLQQAYERVIGDGEAKKLFERFRDTQLGLQEKQMEGDQITEEEVEEANQLVEEVQQNSYISHLLETEQRLNMMINEISQIITKPLEQMYSETVE